MKTERVLKKNAIKAYKAFNSDLTCRGFQYEVGKTYSHNDVLKLCEAGFHACERLVDCFIYYDPDRAKTRICEILVWGDIQRNTEDTKLCASRIHSVKEVSWNKVCRLCNNIGIGNQGLGNSGNYNSGNSNSGNWNTGNNNGGKYNSGNCNAGLGNVGTGNIGNNNCGHYNYGHRNSGNNNIGCRNVGNYNMGCNNVGNWNKGSFNIGCFNTADATVHMFNKPVVGIRPFDILVPGFCIFDTTEWVSARCMTDEEKRQHPEYVTTGGYQKQYDYKEAFRKSFEKAKRLPDWPEQLKRLKALPNFDAKIFEEISGIKEEELV